MKNGGLWTMALIVLLSLLMMLAYVERASAQELPDVITSAATRTAETVSKINIERPQKEMEQFTDSLQQSLDNVLDPRLAVPTAVPKGKGNRVWQCVERRYGPARCKWMVDTGR